jgi:hypothetical protein
MIFLVKSLKLMPLASVLAVTTPGSWKLRLRFYKGMGHCIARNRREGDRTDMSGGGMLAKSDT